MGSINIAGVVEESYTDGLGIRYAIFVQGCSHKCKNCHNPETWQFNGGVKYDIDTLVSEILENPLLDGVTISGGDPMYQPVEVLELVNKIREQSKLNIWLYTGFTFEECLENTEMAAILNKIDILVDGEYKEENRSLHLRFRGSSNQRIINVPETLATGKVVIYIDD